MIRQTSIEVYREIEASGILSHRRWEVYSALYKNGPLTRNEIAPFVNIPGYHSNISARLTELREMGIVMEVGEKLCSMTGNSIILWDVTDQLPRKLRQRINVKDIRLICGMCGRSWQEEKLQSKIKNKNQIHSDAEGQYCFGELSRYKRIK